MLPNVAIALFVKDEFSDIAGWIAWHAALGVQTFFVYDDYSTDGTWEILQAAAKCYDIRLRRTDSALSGLTDRQRTSYLDAIRECRQNFDWLGFLDGDEYLYLKHFDNLPDFLVHFSHADAIAFSWRIYGSSERVVRPDASTVQAFTQHASKDFFDNQHIKSFVRPEKMGPNYFNPHNFDIPQERYVRPSGKFVPQAHALQEVEWSDGFVMHFICRSMEHYIQRIKRRLREDLFDTTSYWHHFNRNEETDLEPLRLIPQMERKLIPIRQECLKSAILKLKDLPVTPDPALYPVKNIPDQIPEVFKIFTHCQTTLYYCKKNKQILHCSAETARKNKFKPVLGAVTPKTQTLMTLFVSRDTSSAILNLAYDNRFSGRPVYRIIHKEDAKHALFNPGSKQFISFLPLDEKGIGRVEVNREKAHDWEKLTFKYLPHENPPFSFPDLPFVPSSKTSLFTVLNWLKTSEKLPDADCFLSVLYCLSPTVQQEISNYVSGILWGFI